MNPDRLYLSGTEVLSTLTGQKVTEPKIGPTAQFEVYRQANGETGIVAIHANTADLISLSSTACVAMPACFPLASLVHLFDSAAFEGIKFAANREAPNTSLLARLGMYLSICELFTYLNEDRPAPPSFILSQYSKTLSYALTRAKIVWPDIRLNCIYDRWLETRKLTGWNVSPPLDSKILLHNLNYWLGNRTDFEWAKPLILAAKIERPSKLIEIASQLVSEKFQLGFSMPPASFDARFEWMRQAIEKLSSAGVAQQDVEFSVGLLLASVEPGELMHLNWLRPHLSSLPYSAIHYAGWSAIFSPQTISQFDVFNGLGRRLIKDLERPFRQGDSPTEDISWIDLRGSAELLDESLIRASTRHFQVSLVPGVNVGASLNKLTDSTLGQPNKNPINRGSRIEKSTPAATQDDLFELTGEFNLTTLKHLRAQIHDLVSTIDKIQPRAPTPLPTTRKSRSKQPK